MGRTKYYFIRGENFAEKLSRIQNKVRFRMKNRERPKIQEREK